MEKGVFSKQEELLSITSPPPTHHRQVLQTMPLWRLLHLFGSYHTLEWDTMFLHIQTSFVPHVYFFSSSTTCKMRWPSSSAGISATSAGNVAFALLHVALYSRIFFRMCECLPDIDIEGNFSTVVRMPTVAHLYDHLEGHSLAND